MGFLPWPFPDGCWISIGYAEEKDTVYCLNAVDGKERWRFSYESSLDDRFFEGGPTSTPTIDGESVYVLSRQGDLFCLSTTTGKLRWSRNLQKDWEVRVPGWGFSCSPLIQGGRLLLNAGESGMALDKTSGELLWKSEDGEAGYMTPMPLEIDGQAYMVIASGKFYQLVDITSGKVAWKHRWLTTYGCNAASPIVQQRQVFVSSVTVEGLHCWM